jgi:5-methylcytosine-specific restriction endonuclease McrA
MSDEILEFIERLKNDEEFQNRVKTRYQEGIYKSNNWQRQNRQAHKECVKRYEATEKGKIARKKVTKKRWENFKKSCMELTWEEKEKIGEFYRNCPESYEVDHIQPIARGGKHTLSNLQYLTKQENRVKAYKWNNQ